MALTKEIAQQENSRTTADCMELHLWKEGTFMRAYDWSAWLACRYLHDFKANKRQFKDIGDAVAYIGFPETSLGKWLPEGAEQRVEGEKHLVLRLPDVMAADELDAMQAAYAELKNSIPMAEANPGLRKGVGREANLGEGLAGGSPATLTSIMQRVLAILTDYDNTICVSAETLRELVIQFNTKKAVSKYWNTSRQMLNSIRNEFFIDVLPLREDNPCHRPQVRHLRTPNQRKATHTNLLEPIKLV